eukprot:m.146904 g.146904  ORF g.146904 m.146904 type:complete len:376 (-) comp14156_c0_seq6:119-1246(-)
MDGDKEPITQDDGELTLPIHLDSTHLRARLPLLAKSLLRMQQVFRPDGVRHTRYKELLEAKQRLHDQRVRCLKATLIFNELMTAVEDVRLKQHDPTAAFDTTLPDSVSSALEGTLGYAHATIVKSSLSAASEPDGHASTATVSPLESWTKESAARVAKLVDLQLQRKARTIVELEVASTRPDEAQRLILAKLAQIPSSIQERLEKIEENRTLSYQRLRLHLNTELALLQIQCKRLALLDKMIHSYLLGSKAQHNATTATWLVLRCRATRYKIGLLIQRALAETYTSATISGLKVVLRSMATKLDEIRKDTQVALEALEDYKVLGPSFETIVSEYAQVLDDIESARYVSHHHDHLRINPMLRRVLKQTHTHTQTAF